MVESKREEFRNLKQGSLSVYDYNKLFQKLARFAKQDVPDEKSMIYQFRGGLREEIQLALVLFEPLRYDEFYNMALKQEAAQLRCDASRSESEMLLLLPLLKWPSSRSIGFLLLRSVSRISRRAKVAVVLPTHPTLAFRTRLRLKLQGRVLRITVCF